MCNLMKFSQLGWHVLSKSQRAANRNPKPGMEKPFVSYWSGFPKSLPKHDKQALLPLLSSSQEWKLNPFCWRCTFWHKDQWSWLGIDGRASFLRSTFPATVKGKLPKEWSSQQSYPARMSVNHNNDQRGTLSQSIDMHTLVVNGSSVIVYKNLNRREIKASTGWKSSQLPRAREIMALGAEPTVATLLKKHDPFLPPPLFWLFLEHTT